MIFDLDGLEEFNSVFVHNWQGSNDYGADRICLYTSETGEGYEFLGDLF